MTYSISYSLSGRLTFCAGGDMAQDMRSKGAGSAGPEKSVKLNVFISYSRQDSAFVDDLQEALAAHGIEAFVDREQIEKGEAWWARITQLITEADTIVFVLSPSSADSKICNDEVAFGEKLNKRFIPIVARELEGRQPPPALARLNYIFFTSDPAVGPTRDFGDVVVELVRALETDIPWIREHTRLGAIAARWEARNRPNDLLLRGAELGAAETWLTTRPDKTPDPTDAHRSLVTLSRRASTRRQRMTVGALLAALIVATALSGVAIWQRGIAVQVTGQAQTTESGQLADAASRQTNDELGADSGTAVLLALEGLPDSASPDPVARERKYSSEAAIQLNRSLSNLRERLVAAELSKQGSTPMTRGLCRAQPFGMQRRVRC
jgi:TIR domain